MSKPEPFNEVFETIFDAFEGLYLTHPSGFNDMLKEMHAIRKENEKLTRMLRKQMMELGQVKEVYMTAYRDAQEDIKLCKLHRDKESLNKLAEEFCEYYAMKCNTKEKQDD